MHYSARNQHQNNNEKAASYVQASIDTRAYVHPRSSNALSREIYEENANQYWYLALEPLGRMQHNAERFAYSREEKRIESAPIRHIFRFIYENQ